MNTSPCDTPQVKKVLNSKIIGEAFPGNILL
jgi:hypothetical protein